LSITALEHRFKEITEGFKKQEVQNIEEQLLQAMKIGNSDKPRLSVFASICDNPEEDETI
jgi:hypothetical protein